MSGEIISERQIKELIETLNALPEKIEKNIVRSAVRSGAAIIRDAIRSKVPIKTGELKKSIKVKQRGGKKGVVVFKIKTGTNKQFKQAGTGAPRQVNYARQIEFGNSKMAAKPFIRPAFDEVENKVLDSVIEKIKFRVDVVNNSKGGERGWQ